MNKYFFLFLVLVLLGCEKEETITSKPLHVKPPSEVLHVDEIKAELSKIDTTVYIEKYIEKIINEGSNQNLGFATRTMDPGIAHTMDAQNISRYVMILRDQKSTDNNKANQAQIFYTSNCGGCHGDDGKGLNGTFPDLTIKTLLGIEKRRDFLLSKLKD